MASGSAHFTAFVVIWSGHHWGDPACAIRSRCLLPWYHSAGSRQQHGPQEVLLHAHPRGGFACQELPMVRAVGAIEDCLQGARGSNPQGNRVSADILLPPSRSTRFCLRVATHGTDANAQQTTLTNIETPRLVGRACLGSLKGLRPYLMKTVDRRFDVGPGSPGSKPQLPSNLTG